MSPTEDIDPRQLIVLIARPAEGGIRSHIIQLLRYGDRSRYTFTLAAPFSLLESLAGESLPPFDRLELPISNHLSVADLVSARRLAAYVSGAGIAVHAHGIRAGFIASLANGLSKRFPLIVTFHNVPPFTRLGKIALHFISSRSEAQIAVSRAIAPRLPRKPAPSIIPNGIALDYFGEPAVLSASQRQCNLASPQITVGTVARLSPEKGVDILLEAARLTPNVRYIIAGAGAEEAKLKAIAPANITFLGYVADTRVVYAESNIVVIPSRSEGQGIVALEAMASGVPVIAANVGGLAESIIDGVTGVLVAPENPKALADTVLSLSQNAVLRTTIADAARKWVTHNADVRLRVAEVEDIYKTIAEQYSSARRL